MRRGLRAALHWVPLHPKGTVAKQQVEQNNWGCWGEQTCSRELGSSGGEQNEEG